MAMAVPAAEEIVKRIQSHKGVQGVIVTTRDGMVISSTMDNTSTVVYIGGMKALYLVSSSLVRDIDPDNQLQFMRVRTKKYELILNVSPEDDYMAVVIQNPNED